MIENFLTLEDFQERIEGIEDNFEWIKTLRPYWTQLKESGIYSILPATSDFWKTKPGVAKTEELTLIHAAFKVYAVYAIWAAYTIKAGVMNTESGLIEKVTDGAAPIDEKRRITLFRDLSDSATRHLILLSGLVQNETTCRVVTPIGNDQRVSIITPRNKSRF